MEIKSFVSCVISEVKGKKIKKSKQKILPLFIRV